MFIPLCMHVREHVWYIHAFMYVCMWVYEYHCLCVGVRGQLIGVNFLLPVDSENRIQVVRLGGKHLYPLRLLF